MDINFSLGVYASKVVFFPFSILLEEERGRRGSARWGVGERKQFEGWYLDCIVFFNEISTIFLRELLNVISI